VAEPDRQGAGGEGPAGAVDLVEEFVEALIGKFQQMPGFVAVLRGPCHLFEYVNDAYVAIAGSRDFWYRRSIARSASSWPSRIGRARAAKGRPVR
jgi:hypothetical protein